MDVLVHHGAGHALRYDVCLSVPMKHAGVLVMHTIAAYRDGLGHLPYVWSQLFFSFKWKILFQV